MWALTCVVPKAACCTLRQFPASAARLLFPRGLRRREIIPTSRSIVPAMPWMAVTAVTGCGWNSAICRPCRRFAFAVAVCSSNALTSDGHDGKPRPPRRLRSASLSRVHGPERFCLFRQWCLNALDNVSDPGAAAFDSSLTRSLVWWRLPTASAAIPRRFLHLPADLV